MSSLRARLDGFLRGSHVTNLPMAMSSLAKRLLQMKFVFCFEVLFQIATVGLNPASYTRRERK